MRCAAAAIKVYSVGAQETSHAQFGMRSSRYAWCYRQRSVRLVTSLLPGQTGSTEVSQRGWAQHVRQFRSWVELFAARISDMNAVML